MHTWLLPLPIFATVVDSSLESSESQIILLYHLHELLKLTMRILKVHEVFQSIYFDQEQKCLPLKYVFECLAEQSLLWH